MKKYLFLLANLILANFLSAQDTIPFKDPCFLYPLRGGIYDFGPQQSTGLRTFRYPPEYIHNKYYIEHIVHSKDGNGVEVYGFAITSDSTLPAELTVVLYREPIYRRGVLPIDSLNCSDAFYHKQMFYNYRWSNVGYDSPDTTTHSATAPCHIYLFNSPVSVPDTFFYKTTAKDQPFSLRELSCYMDSSYQTENSQGLPRGNGWGGYSHYYPEGYNQSGGYAFSTWGGIFPILSLPCPPASRPEIVESQQGSVRFAWWEGDTNLYRIAIHSYPDSTLLFLSDTLTDSTFHLTDSLMAHMGLPEGRYYIRLQRACNYMDSPFDTLLWSPWSYARMFYYAPAPVVIDNPDLHAPLFSLSPNPATNTVTVECFGDTEGDKWLQILDLEGREVYTQAFKQSRNQTITIDVSTLAPGVYLLRLHTPQGSASKKLIIH